MIHTTDARAEHLLGGSPRERRAFIVLAMLLAKPAGGPTGLARRLGVSRSTVLSLLTIAAAAGYGADVAAAYGRARKRNVNT